MAKRPFRFLRHAFAVAVITLGGVLVAPSAAHATPFPETYLADSAGHAYCLLSNFDNYPEHRSRVHWGMDRLDAQTQMTAIFEGCAGGTDIWFSRVDLPAGTRGRASCQQWLSGNRCDSNVVWLDFAEINIGGNDVYDQQAVVVHEVGHTVGLGHHSVGGDYAHDCAMFNYVTDVPSTDIKWRSYHAHDVSHINAAY